MVVLTTFIVVNMRRRNFIMDRPVSQKERIFFHNSASLQILFNFHHYFPVNKFSVFICSQIFKLAKPVHKIVNSVIFLAKKYLTRRDWLNSELFGDFHNGRENAGKRYEMFSFFKVADESTMCQLPFNFFLDALKERLLHSYIAFIQNFIVLYFVVDKSTVICLALFVLEEFHAKFVQPNRSFQCSRAPTCSFRVDLLG